MTDSARPTLALQALQRWQTLGRRERLLIGAAVLVILATTIFLLAWEPAWKGRKLLERELPVLRTQVGQMRTLAAEAKQLGNLSPNVGTEQAIRGQLERSIAAAGMGTQLGEFTRTGQIIDVRFKSVPFANWLSWLDSASRDTRLKVLSVSVQREASAGLVSARVSFELPKRAER